MHFLVRDVADGDDEVRYAEPMREGGGRALLGAGEEPLELVLLRHGDGGACLRPLTPLPTRWLLLSTRICRSLVASQACSLGWVPYGSQSAFRPQKHCGSRRQSRQISVTFI